MLLSTPGLVLHTTPYGESSVVAKVFTRQLGVRSYIIKGVRNGRSRVKQNLMQPLCSVDMVVYCNPKNDLNHVRELTPRHPDYESRPVGNALRFFMTEVLYKAIREEEPMPELWDYVEETCQRLTAEREAPTLASSRWTTTRSASRCSTCRRGASPPRPTRPPCRRPSRPCCTTTSAARRRRASPTPSRHGAP